MHVVPLQGSLGANDTDVLGRHVASVDSGSPHTAYSTAFVTHQNVSVVLQRVTGAYECLTVTQNLLQLLIRADQLRHVVRMGGQIAQYEGTANLSRVNTPLLAFCLHVSLCVTAKAMCVAQVDHVNLTDIAILDHSAHLLQQFKTGEAVGYANDLALFLSQLLDFFALLYFKEQRLLADNMQASFQSSLGNFIMQEVRGSYVNSLDAIRTLCLFLEHALVIRIQAILIHAQVQTELLATLEVYVECSCLQYEGGVVAHCAQTMLIAYATGGAAAYDAPNVKKFILIAKSSSNLR